jgi:uncharacterized membrane protein
MSARMSRSRAWLHAGLGFLLLAWAWIVAVALELSVLPYLVPVSILVVVALARLQQGTPSRSIDKKWVFMATLAGVGVALALSVAAVRF